MIRRFNNTAPVDEIFFSYQGEGIFAGIPQIFVRFAGCNLKCDYCDTAKSLKINLRTKYYTNLSLYQKICGVYAQNKKKFFLQKPSVSFTGGEPLLYSDFLKDLLPKLKEDKFSVYIETNGTLTEKLKTIYSYCDVIAMDIKFKSSCKRDCFCGHQKFLKAAKNKVFVKTVITESTNRNEFVKAVKIISKTSKNIKLVIQPAKNCKTVNQKIFEFYLLASSVLKDVRILPQLHKIWKIR